MKEYAVKSAFREDEQGQDLVEYTLLLAFIACAIGAFYTGLQPTMTNIWTTVNVEMTNANNMTP
jgi:Flp pilus assembly pilin Flp